MSDSFLTPEELQELTGTDSPAKQMKVLSDHGINFVRGVNNHIAVTWYAVNHPNKKFGSDGEPNWSALGAA